MAMIEVHGKRYMLSDGIMREILWAAHRDLDVEGTSDEEQRLALRAIEDICNDIEGPIPEGGGPR
jgi:hypothetical protein